jgi:hypothetical protein
MAGHSEIPKEEATAMKKHEWREKTEEGGTRLVTATRHAGKWQLQSRLKSEDEWTKFPEIELDDLEALLDVVERKYQRNRVPHEHVKEVEQLIATARRKPS